MAKKFLFYIFTIGLASNIVTYSPFSYKVEGNRDGLALPPDVKETGEKNFLPFDFSYLKNIGPLAKRIFGSKKAAAVFSSFVFSGVFAYSVCNYFFKRRPTNTPLKGAETIDVSGQVKEDVVTGDGTSTENIPDITSSDTNTDSFDNPKDNTKVSTSEMTFSSNSKPGFVREKGFSRVWLILLLPYLVQFSFFWIASYYLLRSIVCIVPFLLGVGTSKRDKTNLEN